MYLSKNKELIELLLSNNNFVALNLEINEKLEKLILDNNSLTYLNLSKNSNMEFLSINSNDLITVNVKNNNNEKLDYLYISNNIRYVVLTDKKYLKYIISN